MQSLNREGQLILAAFMFYTRLPVPAPKDHSDTLLNESRKYFPLIGIVVGATSVFTFGIAEHIWNPAIAVVISILTTVLLTGAFHEDGFADSCDGLGGGWDKDQVLTIMKDSRVGTYAVVGLVLLLLLKFASYLSAVQTLGLFTFTMMVVTGHTVSRQLSSAIIERYQYVQDIDQSKVKPITDRHLTKRQQVVSLGITTIPFSISLLIDPWATIIATIAATLSSGVFIQYCEKRIGGYTGDILGATQQISELIFYLAFLGAAL